MVFVVMDVLIPYFYYKDGLLRPSIELKGIYVSHKLSLKHE